jgi:hypothetical protein
MIRTYLSETPLAGARERAFPDDFDNADDLRELLHGGLEAGTYSLSFGNLFQSTEVTR